MVSGKCHRGSDRDPNRNQPEITRLPSRQAEVEPVIKVDAINFLIVWAFVLIGRFIANTLAALTHDSPIGQALSLVAA